MTDITTHESSRRRLLIALGLTCTFMVIQIVGAYYSNSLTAIADAGHLFVHNSTLFIALIASSLAIHFAKTYNDGYHKTELTGGLINGILYLIISLVILYHGGERFIHQHEGQAPQINSYLMSVVAAIGFVFHGTAAWVLYKGRKASVNIYAVFLHSFFDILSTISTFVSGILIHLTGWNVIDIISSMLISLFVLFTGIRVVIKCVKGLRANSERLPDIDKIEQTISGIDHVYNVHNVTIAKHDKVLEVGAHVVLKNHCTIEKHHKICQQEIEQVLAKKFNVKMCVLQIEKHEC